MARRMRAFRLLTVSLISWASWIRSSRASFSVSGKSKVFMSEGRDQKLLGPVNAGSAAGFAGVFLRVRLHAFSFFAAGYAEAWIVQRSLVAFAGLHDPLGRNRFVHVHRDFLSG